MALQRRCTAEFPWAYGALLYGALWAAAGLFLAVGLQRTRAPLAWGTTCALSLSAAVLVRFVVSRDILAEAPGHWPRALAAGGLAGIVLFALGGLILPRLERRLLQAPALAMAAWSVPVLVLGLFARATQAPETASLYRPVTPPPVIGGKGVILIVADALRADALGVYGAGQHRGAPATPHLDAFAAQAQVFDNASAQASWTKPAMASMLTSRHVSAHDTMSKPAILPSTLPTLGQVLQTHNVTTAAVVTNYNLERSFGFARGFDAYEYLPPARYLGAPPEANRLAAYNVYRLARERLFRSQRAARYFYQPATAVNAAALDIIDRMGQGNFFMWLHYMEPHDPYFAVDGTSFGKVSDPHPNAADAAAMRLAYADGVRTFDTAFGELLQALETRGMHETMIMVVADHGEEFGEHPGGFYHGTSLYEELLHIPLLVRVPHAPPGRRARLVRQIDVAPTVLGYLGVDAPASWEGVNMLTAKEPDVTLAEEDHEGNVLQSVRAIASHTKVIVANKGNPRGLPAVETFDLQRDPHEQNVLPDNATTTLLQQRITTLQQEARRGGHRAHERLLDTAARAELRSLGYVQ